MKNVMTKLNDKALERVNGGDWDFDTITPEELAEFERLIKIRAIMGLDEFIAKLDEKYGESGYNINDFFG